MAQIVRVRGTRVFGIDRHEPSPASPAATATDVFVELNSNTASVLREATGGREADLVFDAVGGVTFAQASACAAPRGRVVEISSTGKTNVEFDIREFYHDETV